MKWRPKVSKVCQYCGIPYTTFKAWDRGSKYCSRECTHAGRRGVRPKTWARTFKACEECGNQFQVRRYRKETAKFCSYGCLAANRGRRMRGVLHPNWKGGISERTFQSRQIISILRRKSDTCARCNKQSRQLQGHHVVPVSMYPELEAFEDNIVLLCPDCHAGQHPKWKNMIVFPRVRSGDLVPCEQCGRKTYAPPHRLGKKRFCSHECSRIALWKGNRKKTSNG